MNTQNNSNVKELKEQIDIIIDNMDASSEYYYNPRIKKLFAVSSDPEEFKEFELEESFKSLISLQVVYDDSTCYLNNIGEEVADILSKNANLKDVINLYNELYSSVGIEKESYKDVLSDAVAESEDDDDLEAILDEYKEELIESIREDCEDDISTLNLSALNSYLNKYGYIVETDTDKMYLRASALLKLNDNYSEDFNNLFSLVSEGWFEVQSFEGTDFEYYNTLTELQCQGLGNLIIDMDDVKAILADLLGLSTFANKLANNKHGINIHEPITSFIFKDFYLHLSAENRNKFDNIVLKDKNKHGLYLYDSIHSNEFNNLSTGAIFKRAESAGIVSLNNDYYNTVVIPR